MELDPPPGDWAAAASPTSDDPAVAPPDRRAVLGSQRLWPDWDSILHDRSLLKDGPFFLELFARLAGLTEAVHLAGVPVLPPVDIIASHRRVHSANISTTMGAYVRASMLIL